MMDNAALRHEGGEVDADEVSPPMRGRRGANLSRSSLALGRRRRRCGRVGGCHADAPSDLPGSGHVRPTDRLGPATSLIFVVVVDHDQQWAVETQAARPTGRGTPVVELFIVPARASAWRDGQAGQQQDDHDSAVTGWGVG